MFVPSDLIRVACNYLTQVYFYLWINLDKINWKWVSRNPNAIHLLEKNPDKINWCYLSGNPNAIPLLEKNQDKIDWEYLSRNPNAIPLLEKNQDKIDWYELSKNPSIFEIKFDKKLYNLLNKILL